MKLDLATTVRASRQAAKNIRNVVSFPPPPRDEVLTSCRLSCIKRRFVDRGWIVARDGTAHGHAFLASACVAFRLVLAKRSPIPQHAVDGRVIPRQRRSEWRNFLSIKVVRYCVATYTSNSQFKYLPNDFGSLWQEDKALTIVSQCEPARARRNLFHTSSAFSWFESYQAASASL